MRGHWNRGAYQTNALCSDVWAGGTRRWDSSQFQTHRDERRMSTSKDEWSPWCEWDGRQEEKDVSCTGHRTLRDSTWADWEPSHWRRSRADNAAAVSEVGETADRRRGGGEDVDPKESAGLAQSAWESWGEYSQRDKAANSKPSGSARRCRSQPPPGQAQHFDEPPCGRDFLECYELGKRLAAGHKGVVYLASERSSARTVVVKKPRNSADKSDYVHLAQKAHPNVVRVFDCFSEASETCIVMEYCAGGDLFQAIQSLGKPNENWSAAVFEQILLGVQYLHEHFNEAHNDLKPENILLDRPASPHDVPRIVLADFGCAAGDGEVSLPSGGDPRYRAPEILWGASFGLATDAWALGVVLYEVLSGGLLIHTQHPNVCSYSAFREHANGEDCRRLLTALRAGQDVDVSAAARGHVSRSLLVGLLDVERRTRLTVSAALKHAWLGVHDGASEVDHQEATAKPVSEDMPEPASRPKVPGTAWRGRARCRLGGC